MSISDIMAIRNLLPGGEPEFVLKPDETKKLYKFRDKADEAAALAEADRILKRLREAFGDDQAAVTEEFHEIIEGNERLQTAVLKAVCREICKEIDASEKKPLAKPQRKRC